MRSVIWLSVLVDDYATVDSGVFDEPFREVVRLRKQDKNERDERESLLDVYMHALETS